MRTLGGGPRCDPNSAAIVARRPIEMRAYQLAGRSGADLWPQRWAGNSDPRPCACSAVAPPPRTRRQRRDRHLIGRWPRWSRSLPSCDSLWRLSYSDLPDGTGSTAYSSSTVPLESHWRLGRLGLRDALQLGWVGAVRRSDAGCTCTCHAIGDAPPGGASCVRLRRGREATPLPFVRWRLPRRGGRLLGSAQRRWPPPEGLNRALAPP